MYGFVGAPNLGRSHPARKARIAFPAPWGPGCAPSPLAVGPGPGSIALPTMISPETLNQIENIKKRAGHLWRFL